MLVFVARLGTSPQNPTKFYSILHGQSITIARTTYARGKNSYSHEAFRHVFLLPSFIIYGHIGNTWHFIYEPKKCLFITSSLIPQKLDRSNGILKPLGWFNGIVQANLLNKSNTVNIYLNPLFRFESLSMKTGSALHISSTPLEMTHTLRFSCD